MKQNSDCLLTSAKVQAKRNLIILKFHWIVEWHEWYLWKYQRIQSRQGMENIHRIWRYFSDINLNKKHPIVAELFRELNIFLLHNLIFLYQKDTRVNPTHYFIMKILNKWELQQIASNHSSDIDFIYKKYTEKPSSFLVIDATLA